MSLKNGDLKNTILSVVSIDEFQPKAGKTEDVIVVAFYIQDLPPAEDLNTFIQRGFVDTLDVEVSPNTDEDGRYLVFVEMNRDETFPKKLEALLLDVSNLAKNDWKIKTYLSGDKTFSIKDPELFQYVILNPKQYVTKDKFNMDEIKEGIKEFFRNSFVQNLTIDGNTITMLHNRRKIVTEVVDIGDYDTVIGRNFLSESAFGVGQRSFEATVLEHMLGDCNILPLGKYLCVSRGEQVMLLNNTELIYGT